MGNPGGIPARPPSLQFLLWDGTKPRDSYELGNGLSALRWGNLLHDSPPSEFSPPNRNRPRVFQPAGADGNKWPDAAGHLTSGTFSVAHWQRGMYEFPRTFFDPTHHNRGDDRPNFLAYSGHGIPGYMFAESMLLVCSSRPMIGDFTNWHFVSNPRWNHPAIKVVLFSACRQLCGKPQQFLWSEAMRGTNPVHTILAYRNTAPSADASADINRTLLQNLRREQPFVQAWKNAHSGPGLRRRWAALCYEAAKTDRFDRWTRTGTLPTISDTTGPILYFDSDHDYPNTGRVVQRPTQHFDCWLTMRNDAQRIPPWMLFGPNKDLELHIELLQAGQRFEDGDRLWIAAIQVRPDYGGPFNIRSLFTIAGTPDPPAIGAVPSFGKLHDRSVGWGSGDHDVYIFQIAPSLSWLHRTSPTHLRIPIRLKSQFNNHLPIFYFMLCLKKARGGTAFGIPTTTIGGEEIADQQLLVDDFQFAVFVLGT